MTKPSKTLTFIPIQGIWKEVSAGDSARMLSDVLEDMNLQIDEKTEFARIIDYEQGLRIWYRAKALKITIEIWEM